MGLGISSSYSGNTNGNKMVRPADLQTDRGRLLKIKTAREMVASTKVWHCCWSNDREYETRGQEMTLNSIYSYNILYGRMNEGNKTRKESYGGEKIRCWWSERYKIPLNNATPDHLLTVGCLIPLSGGTCSLQFTITTSLTPLTDQHESGARKLECTKLKETRLYGWCTTVKVYEKNDWAGTHWHDSIQTMENRSGKNDRSKIIYSTHISWRRNEETRV